MLLRISCRNDNRNHKKKKKRNPKNNNKRRCYYFLLSLPPSFFFLSFFFLDSFVEKTMAHDGGLIIKKGEPNGRQSLDEFNFAFFFFHVCSPQEILNSSAAAAIICICTAKKKEVASLVPIFGENFFLLFETKMRTNEFGRLVFCFVFFYFSLLVFCYRKQGYVNPT